MFEQTRVLWAEHKGLLAFGFLILFFSGFGQSIFFGPYLPDFQRSLSLSKTAVGSLYAGATVTSSFIIVYTGRGLDSWPLRRFVAVVLVGLAAGAALLSSAGHAAVLFIAFLFLRQCGQGLCGLAAQTSVNRYVDINRGKAVALASLGASLMGALFPLLAIGMGEYFDWRTSWRLYSAFILITLVPGFWWMLRHHQSTTHARWLAQMDAETTGAVADSARAPRNWTRREVLADWRFYGLVSLMFLAPFIVTGVAFYQTDIAKSLGLTPLEFASSFTVFTIASVVCTLIAGAVIDRYGERIALIAFCAVYTAALTLLSSGWSLTWVFVGMALLGAGTGIISTAGGPLLVQLYGSKNLGAIKSMLFSSGILASSLSPVMMGYLQDRGVDILTQFSWFTYYAATVWVIAFPLCARREG